MKRSQTKRQVRAIYVVYVVIALRYYVRLLERFRCNCYLYTCILQCELLILHFLSFCLFTFRDIYYYDYIECLHGLPSHTHTYTPTNTYSIVCNHRENSRLLPFDTACILLRPYHRIPFLSLQGLIVVRKKSIECILLHTCTFILGCGLNDFGNSAN